MAERGDVAGYTVAVFVAPEVVDALVSEEEVEGFNRGFARGELDDAVAVGLFFGVEVEPFMVCAVAGAFGFAGGDVEFGGGRERWGRRWGGRGSGGGGDGFRGRCSFGGGWWSG